MLNPRLSNIVGESHIRNRCRPFSGHLKWDDTIENIWIWALLISTPSSRLGQRRLLASTRPGSKSPWVRVLSELVSDTWIFRKMSWYGLQPAKNCSAHFCSQNGYFKTQEHCSLLYDNQLYTAHCAKPEMFQEKAALWKTQSENTVLLFPITRT